MNNIFSCYKLPGNTTGIVLYPFIIYFSAVCYSSKDPHRFNNALYFSYKELIIKIENQHSGRKVSPRYWARLSVQPGEYQLVFTQSVLHSSANFPYVGCPTLSRNVKNKWVAQNQKQETLAAGRRNEREKVLTKTTVCAKE